MTTTLLQDDNRVLLPTLPAGSVQCVVTSPPYWGLRDYGVAGQIGLEATPDAYVQALVAVFRLVWCVLRDDGTLWLNLGDSYAREGGTPGGGNRELMHLEGKQQRMTKLPPASGLKSKDLVGIPWMVAFALRADGWYLRSDIIWAKPNPMPESVTDRPTKAHEYIFLLSKSERYYYDAVAVAEPAIRPGDVQVFGGRKARENEILEGDPRYRGGSEQWGRTHYQGATRNKRTVWNVSTAPYKKAHFATFPEKLIEPCILAGSAARACEVCGAPWERVTETNHDDREFEREQDPRQTSGSSHRTINGVVPLFRSPRITTTGFRPTCACPNDGTGRSIVLDPFVGSGTTLRVAERLGRDSIGIELNPAYIELQEQRTNGVQKVMTDLL